jgi:hypothetical protein
MFLKIKYGGWWVDIPGKDFLHFSFRKKGKKKLGAQNKNQQHVPHDMRELASIGAAILNSYGWRLWRKHQTPQLILNESLGN